MAGRKGPLPGAEWANCKSSQGACIEVNQEAESTRTRWMWVVRRVFWAATLALMLAIRGGPDPSEAYLPRAMQMLLYAIPLIFIVTGFGRAMWIYNRDGKWHCHRQDPRRELIKVGAAAWVRSRPTIVEESPSFICGPIIRMREGGWLLKLLYGTFTFTGYNRIFLPAGSPDALFYKERRHMPMWATIWQSALRDPNKVLISHQPLLWLVERLWKHGSWVSYFVDMGKHERDGHFLRLVMAGQLGYLTEDPNRTEQSAVGRYLRPILRGALMDSGLTEHGVAVLMHSADCRAVRGRLEREYVGGPGGHFSER